MAEPMLDNPGPHNLVLGGTIFHEALDVHIHGGTFNAYGSDGSDQKKAIADAVALLASCAEQGATYDAAAREDVPKCHEHTRVAIINGIQKWAHSQEPYARPFMWMYGPAGSGKTTIMQTVAERFEKDGRVVVSFFFSRRSAARPRDKDKFVITLAHQLAISIPSLRQHLANALESDRSILNKSLSKQLDALVIGPFNKLKSAQTAPPCIVLVDGLDECNGDGAQQDILNLLDQFLRQARHCVRILVASRCLSHIQSFFTRGSIGKLTQTIPLDNNYQSDEDVRQFIISEFGKIRDGHPSRGSLPSLWPSPSNINILVQRASGQFIYASVVMKFIAHHGRHPDESLQTIISMECTRDELPYAELDAIYAQILSTIESQNFQYVQVLMGCLILDKEMFYFARVAQTKATRVIDLTFMFPPGTTDARVHRMSPLITTSSKGMKFSHASFPEYLLDRSRSKEFFLDLRRLHCNLARQWFRLYSTHFKLYPHGGIVPRNIVEYRWDHGTFAERAANDSVLRDVALHCLAAKWTNELRQDIFAFDVHTAFKVGPKPVGYSGQEIYWLGIVLWLNLLFWATRRDHLSPEDSEFLQGRIQSIVMGLPISPADRQTIAVVLTLRKQLAVWDVWNVLVAANSHLDSHNHLILSFSNFATPFSDNIREASCMWLCQTLVPDAELNGLYFSNENLYANVILQYSAFPVSCWDAWLPFILSKALVSEELATFLTQNFLQVQRTSGPLEETEDDFFMAICIYLFQSGVCFHSEHQHRPEFNPRHWLCGICLLFDSYKVDCADVELSRDPDVKPSSQPKQIVDQQLPQPLQIDPVHQPIPVIRAFWLRVWILWVADMVLRFFPVVA